MISEILSGIKAYFGALELLSKLKLWKFFLIPMVISLVLAIIIGGSAYGVSDNIGGYLASFWPWEFGKEAFESVTSVFGGLLVIASGLLIFKHLILALSAPFMGTISESIEMHLTGSKSVKPRASFVKLLIRGLRIAIRNLFRELLLSIPILLLGLIPIIGIFSTVLLFLMQAYFAGFGNMDYTLERHFDYKESVAFVKRNRGVAIGNGIIFMLFLLIPVIGVILVLPFSVTAASSETIQRINQFKIS